MSARSKSLLLTFLLFPGWYTTDHRIVLHTSSLASTTIRGGLQVVRHTLQTIILQAVIGKNPSVKLISRIVLNATVPNIAPTCFNNPLEVLHVFLADTPTSTGVDCEAVRDPMVSTVVLVLLENAVRNNKTHNRANPRKISVLSPFTADRCIVLVLCGSSHSLACIAGIYGRLRRRSFLYGLCPLSYDSTPGRTAVLSLRLECGVMWTTSLGCTE
ncbi:hypothetical protein EDB89DRAFT_1562699 [Lactarius sanguifluus]|nr:hypothetical protein EDB89DRAFT_1562699 [Lactarius sanguifluus]